jgi:hypothetical protein
MAKDNSWFSYFEIVIEKDIFVANDFVLNITGHGDIACRRGHVVDMFHVPSLSVDLLSVFQLT